MEKKEKGREKLRKVRIWVCRNTAKNKQPLFHYMTNHVLEHKENKQ